MNMDKIIEKVKTFFKNKNTVTILGVVIILALLYWGYSNQIKTAVNPVTVPVAAQTIPPRTQIKAEYITTIEVSSIAVTTQPTKVSYSEGDKFDPTGLKLKVTYTDGTEITLDADAVGITYDPDEDTSLATTDTSVTVEFGGKTTTITITVT